MTCDGCAKKAVFKATAEGKLHAKHWCAICFAKKVAKYALVAVRICALVVIPCLARAADIPYSVVSVFDKVSEQASANNQATKAIDQDINTIWHTQYNPSNVPANLTVSPYGWIKFALSVGYLTDGLRLTQRQDHQNGRIGKYHVFVTSNTDCVTGLTEVANGDSTPWPNTAATQTLTWSPTLTRCILIESRLAADGNTVFMGLAEVVFTGVPTAPVVTLTDPPSNYLPGFPTTQPVTLQATASVNSGSVTHVEFYQGATLLFDDTTAPYAYTWSGISAGTYSLTAKAYGSNGESTTTPVSTLIVFSSLTDADADWNARKNAAGVVYANGFDNAGVEIDPYKGNDGNNVLRIAQDTAVKISGAGSLRFDEPPPPHAGANISGSWYYTLPSTNFIEGSTAYIQMRVRYSPEALSAWNFNETTFKTFVFANHGSSCAAVEFAQNNPYNKFVGWYTQCGDLLLQTDPNTGNAMPGGGGDAQQVSVPAGNCRYPSFSNCYKFRPNEWQTFYYKMQIGTWGAANSRFDIWASATDTYTQQQIGLVPQYLINCNQTPCNQEPGKSGGFDAIQITPYMSNLSKYAGTSGVVGHVWVDELIISTQPIPWPGAYIGVDKGRGQGSRGLGTSR